MESPAGPAGEAGFLAPRYPVVGGNPASKNRAGLLACHLLFSFKAPLSSCVIPFHDERLPLEPSNICVCQGPVSVWKSGPCFQGKHPGPAAGALPTPKWGAQNTGLSQGVTGVEVCIRSVSQCLLVQSERSDW